MNGAELKATLKAGGRVYGTMLTHGRDARWAPVLSGIGLDYVVIDTEHSPRSRAELGDYLTAFSSTGVVPIIRIPIPDSHYVTMALDAGAHGVPVLVHHQTTELSTYWVKQGARFVLHTTDRRVLAEAYRRDLAQLRQAAQGAKPGLQKTGPTASGGGFPPPPPS